MSQSSEKKIGCATFALVIGIVILAILAPFLIIFTLLLGGTGGDLETFNINDKYINDAYDYYMSGIDKDNNSKYDFEDLLSRELIMIQDGDFLKYNSNIIGRVKNGNYDDVDMSEEFLDYFKSIVNGVMSNMVGTYYILIPGDKKKKTEDTWKECNGLKVFYPIPERWSYKHYDDFGDPRTYGGERTHEGNDIMASNGTPVINIETGTIEHYGWNDLGGWRLGIRSLDGKRYYYYAHLSCYGYFNKIGQRVDAGQVIGYVGSSGYGPQGTTGKFEPHLHLGIQVTYKVEGEEIKIWINPYRLMKFVERKKMPVVSLGYGQYKPKDTYK